jgi:hypothetical protein
MWSVVLVNRSGECKREVATDDRLSGAVSFAAGWNAVNKPDCEFVAIVVDADHAKQLLADSAGCEVGVG